MKLNIHTKQLNGQRKMEEKTYMDMAFLFHFMVGKDGKTHRMGKACTHMLHKCDAWSGSIDSHDRWDNFKRH